MKEEVKVTHVGAYSQCRSSGEGSTELKHYFLQTSDGKSAIGDTNIPKTASIFSRMVGFNTGLELIVLHPGVSKNSNPSEPVTDENNLRDFARYLSQSGNYKFGIVISEEPIDLPL